MILDLHIHSKYSYDCLLEPKDILRAAKKKGLNGIAITDHDTIKGGVETREINQDPHFLVIVGIEVCTDIGDIIGLFLNEEIRSRNGMEVIEEIHNQGGIAVIPHPYKGHKLNDEIIRKSDVIEGFNSRTSEENNRKAMELAERYNKPVIAGSDAHFCSEIGACKVILNLTDVRDAILKGCVELETNITPLYMESLSQIIKSINKKRYDNIPVQLILLARNILREYSWK